MKKNYSRNLVVDRLQPMPPGQLVTFADHTGASTQTTCRLFIQNRRNDRAAFNTVAILHSVRNKQTGQQSRPDTAYLKWAGQMGFQKTIFPNDEAELDAFSIRVGQPGVFIHSAADVPRKSIIADVGVYELNEQPTCCLRTCACVICESY